MLSNLEAAGLTLSCVGQALYVEPRNQITDEHRALIREHKPAILAELRGRQVVIELAAEYNLPADELLRWYSDDLSEFATRPRQWLRWLVNDYVQHHRQKGRPPT